jgi:uncharacterized protein YecE (DUF72 family)
MKSTGKFRIGTSGIALPGSKQSFPEEYRSTSRLKYYSSIFNTLEVNSSFKRIPLSSTLVKWCNDVDDRFQFTIKLWGEITHVKKLEFSAESVTTFMNDISAIGTKKGCLLIQFPGKIDFEHFSKLEFLLELLDQADPGSQWRKAIEFRNNSWYVAETFELLKSFDATCVLQDMPKARSLHLDTTSDFVYFRFHGPTGNYRGDYTPEFLQQLALRIKQLLAQKKEVYAYFNNTMGNAYENAKSLRDLVNDY